MSTRVWEAAVAFAGFLLAVLLFIGGGWIEAVVVFSLTFVWFVGRIALVETNVAGSFLVRRGKLRRFQAAGLLLIALLAIGLSVYGVFVGWNESSAGRLLIYALVGVAILLKREIERVLVDADHLQRGGAAERAVGAALAALRDDGWEVIDDWKRDDGRGNVDHAVRGPRGVFSIETKSGRYRSMDLRQAIDNAFWLKAKWHASWVHAVLCVDDESQEPTRKTLGQSPVWVVDRRSVVEWLRTFDRR